MTGLWSALVTPGLALPAAQPQIEFTTISAVPGLSRTVSTSATVLSGVTPHCASSSHIGRTASRSYKGCIRPPLPFLHSLDARAEQVETSIPARAAINKSLSNMAIAPTLRYFILWHCAIKGTTVRATIRHGNVDVFRELLPPQLLFTGLAAPPSFGLIGCALPENCVALSRICQIQRRTEETMRKLYALAVVVLTTLAASGATLISAATSCPPCPFCR
jgi:hypothetical protein